MASSVTTIDPLSRCQSPLSSIYQDGSGLRWSFMLNLTDISYGKFGNNKFYMGQLIQDNLSFVVFRKWGRVGAKTPQKSIQRFTYLSHAREAFQKAFLSKSGNKWPLEGPFVRKKGKYVLVELDDSTPKKDGDMAKAKEKETLPSTLPFVVQNVIQLMCDPKVVVREMTSLNVDLKRFPLGKLSKAQISQGYEILQRLSSTLDAIADLENSAAAPAKRGTKGSRKAKAKAKGPTRVAAQSLNSLKSDLKTLSSEFYTLIPHDFGRSLPPVIVSVEDLKTKLDLLEMLSNLEISQSLKKEETKEKEGLKLHPLDIQYNMLGIDMKPLDTNGQEYKLIARFIETTSTNPNFSIHSVLKIGRPAEEQHNDVLQSLGNHKLLWHGSRLSNFVGILSQGLRIAPPEAPKNGYQFGKGLYFADVLSKSASYCCSSPQNPKGMLLLAEVALGTPYRTTNGEFLDYESVKNGHGCDSTHGLGRMMPAREEYETLEDGLVVPAGKLQPTRETGHLLYSEYIVYRPEQVKLRYLVTMNLSKPTFGW